MRTTILWCVFAIGAIGGLTSCEERTPAEKIEDAAEDMGDAVGDAAEDMSDAAGDAVDDAADKVKEAVDQE